MRTEYVAGMTPTSDYFPPDPYTSLTTFVGPTLHLAAVTMENYPLAEMPALMHGIFPEIFTLLGEIGATVAGPPVAYHRRLPTDTADLSVGVPLTDPLESTLTLASGHEAVAVTCPSGLVAATSYLGSYEGLGNAWGQFMAAVSDAAHTPRSQFFEAYVSNPTEHADPSTVRTDLVIFLDES